MSPHPHQFTSIAEAFGHPLEWARFDSAFRLSQAPKASAFFVESLEAAIRAAGYIGFTPEAPLVEQLQQLASAFRTWLELGTSSSRGFARFDQIERSTPVTSFPVLTGFISPIADDLRKRVDAIRFLLIASVLTGGTASSHRNVANAIRKTRTYPTDWGPLIRKLPSPDSPEWFEHLAETALSMQQPLKKSRYADLAKRDFLASLLSVLRSVNRGPDADERGKLLVEHSDSEPRINEEVDRHESQDAAFIRGDGIGDTETIRMALEKESPDTHEPESKAAVKAQALRTVFRLTELDQRLRWSWDHLNSHELTVLQTALRGSLASADPGCLMCALVLATGQSPQLVSSIPLAPQSGVPAYFEPARGIWTRRVLRPPNAWKKPAAGHAALIQTAREIELTLPAEVSSAIGTALERNHSATTFGALLGCESDPVALLSQWLEPLRAAHPDARFTHGRIARAIRVELMALSNPAAVHSLACQATDIPPTSLYYASFRCSELQTIYSHALHRLFGLLAPQRGVDGFVGSELTVSREALEFFVHDLRGAYEAAARKPSYAAAHNAYVRYILWMLLLSVGHRSVSDPFESFGLFDLDAGFVVVNDKATFDAKKGRLVPLSALAISQLTCYRVHLERLRLRLLKDARNDIADKVSHTLSGRIGQGFPLFFLLSENYSTERISDAQLRSMTGTLAGLPTNFARHHLSQFAATASASNDLVAEMLGHLENYEPALGARSPLCPSDFEPIRRHLDSHLRSLGFEEFSSPIADLESASIAVPRLQSRPELLGTALRASLSSKRRTQAIRLARELTRRHLGRPAQPNQKIVDSLFAELLRGKPFPTTQSELIAFAHANRVLRELKYRRGLRLKLPEFLSPAPRAAVPFVEESLEICKLARELKLQFHRLLGYRARQPARGPTLPLARAAAEAAASLALHSGITDLEVIDSLLEQSPFCCLDTRAFGIYAEFLLVRRNQQPETRRYRLHPVTALLLNRLARRNLSGAQKADRAREFRELVSRLGTEAGSAPDFATNASARTVARWLIRTIAPLIRLEVPGNVAAYLEGTHRPVGLPLDDWVQVVTGRPIRDDLRKQRLDAHDSVERTAPAEMIEPAAVLATQRNDSLESEARSRGMVFHRQIRIVLREAHAPRVDGKQHIRTEVRRLRERSLRVPEVPLLLAQWLEHLAEHGTYEGPVAARSCDRYYYGLAPRMIEVLASVQLTVLNDDALTTAYSDFMETVPVEGQFYVFRRLQEFHRFLMDRHGFPTLEWSEIAPLSCVKSTSIDAGFITWENYEAVLNLLLQDRWANDRERVMQATAWLLIFRFGARTSEALGLRRKDLIVSSKQVIVLFRPNDYRSIKSDAGIRQVPLVGPLGTREREILNSWLAHIDEYTDTDWLAPIFSEHQSDRLIADRDAIARRITAALRAVTGSMRARPHDGRHSFASRLEWLMTFEDLEISGPQRLVTDRVLGPCDPRETRQLLLDTEDRSKRAFWAVALAIGHASPDMTFRTYTHLGDLLSGHFMSRYFEKNAVKLERSAWRYVSGDAPLPRKQMQRGSRSITLNDQVVRDVASTLRQVRQLAERRSRNRALPPKREVDVTLTPAIIDRTLEIAHRRGRIDTVSQRLLIPSAWLPSIFKTEFQVRELAGYGIRDSRWVPTTLDASYEHGRTSNRPPSETRRINLFLQSLEGNLNNAEFIASTRAACGAWLERYRPDSTPLVLNHAIEVVDVVGWSLSVGLSADLLDVRVPEHGLDPSEIRLLLSARGLPATIVRYPAEVAFARARHPPLGRLRAAFILRDNSVGPLTTMVQVHRSLHVLATWLLATKRCSLSLQALRTV